MVAETAGEMEQRLLTVITTAQFDALGVHAFEVLPDGPAGASPLALACVRDGDVWSQLVPVADVPAGGRCATERYAMFVFRFAPGVSAAGFVAWLASHIKRTVGCGVIVVCGKDRRGGEAQYHASQGVFDYWGCPPDATDAVEAAVRQLIRQGSALGNDE